MITLAEIRHHPDVVEALEWPFDFCLLGAEREFDPITLEPPLPFHVIAEDGTGGVFLAYGEGAVETLPILHATSEGQAGRVASNLTEWLGLLVSIPYWRDLLKFSGNGKINEMRIAEEFMKMEYAEDYPELPEAREVILMRLAIPKITDPVQVLHSNVHASGCSVISDDGDEWESLFNTFTAADNPSWTMKKHNKSEMATPRKPSD